MFAMKFLIFSLNFNFQLLIMYLKKNEFRLRRLLFPIGIFAATQFMSCKTDDAVEDLLNDNSNVQKERKEEPSLNYRALFSTHHTIGEDEAKELALDASSLFSMDGNALRSGRMRQICDVRVLHSEESTLRSGSGEEIPVPDTLAYVCNFADSAGFAIICADDRVGCPILACVDNGTLGEVMDNPGLAIFLDNAQVFMQNSIMKFEMEKDSLLEVAKQRIAAEDSLWGNVLKRKYSGTYSVLHATEEVKPLLPTVWGQSKSPYNDMTPSCKSNESGHAPTGCWATAIAQVMAYYRDPSAFRHSSTGSANVVLDWNKILSVKDARYLNDETARRMVSQLLIYIGRNIDMDYDCDGSSAKRDRAMMFLKRLYYSGCETKSYDFQSVKNQLDKARPVMMSGDRRRIVISFKGHAWVVDGYSAIPVESYWYEIDTDRNTMVQRCLKSTYDNPLLHINWGWMGSDNGYFAAGCFDTSKAKEYDYEKGRETYNYRYDLEIHTAWR